MLQRTYTVGNSGTMGSLGRIDLLICGQIRGQRARAAMLFLSFVANYAAKKWREKMSLREKKRENGKPFSQCPKTSANEQFLSPCCRIWGCRLQGAIPSGCQAQR